MFEKSLYDLIRGLRNHRGNEKEYIKDSLRECRNEIKGQDMDLKATALLKLTYLEMFGHDMSWASFNVLEVMSSQKYHQKRVGYLAAVQSFRPDTEVLMLAENLLKKDLSSPQITTISLPLTALPHLMSRSMANSLLSEILPRLSHSSPMIRKKTIVILYRLALVYPETLRPAWPKIKERLLDESEDSTVTAAIVNVVCELGWRRPQDFLPLAPRLFDLLVDGNNNWMAIKIIKLFAHLTPLEPRLVRKLLPPLTTLIKTTPAMSLLYECINGIIQGGILKTSEGTREGDEIASLCISKLRGMLVVEGDPNLKYVAVLAFNKIVESHPTLVAEHEDVILECVDDLDISIRLRALDLVVGMVDSTNLVSIVDRLVRQLKLAPTASDLETTTDGSVAPGSIMPTADSDEEEVAQPAAAIQLKPDEEPPLPDDYRASVLSKILDMCKANTYANISDFDWYIDTLVTIVKYIPESGPTDDGMNVQAGETGSILQEVQTRLASDIGNELRNVAVRVRSSRREAVQAAERLVSIDKRSSLFPSVGTAAYAVLEAATWTVGEFPQFLLNAVSLMASLTHSSVLQMPPIVIRSYVQAAIKLYSALSSSDRQEWDAERKSTIALMTNGITRFFEMLSSHSDIEVQERAVGYLELTRLASEAISSQGAAVDDGDFTEPPLFLTQALPTLFAGLEINPVAGDAQRKVPTLEGLDLEAPLNANLPILLSFSGFDLTSSETDDLERYYNERPQIRQAPVNEPAADRLVVPGSQISYQQSDRAYSDSEEKSRLAAERRERNRDDPFYIPSGSASGRSTPGHSVFKSGNDDELDLDSIPVMELSLDPSDLDKLKESMAQRKLAKQKKKPKRNIQILGDENVEVAEGSTVAPQPVRPLRGTSGRSLLQLDSSGLGSLSLSDNTGKLDVERREAEDQEMAAAMKEVERLRLEMQRAQERIEAKSETLVTRKKKVKRAKQPMVDSADGTTKPERKDGEDAEASKQKKKKKKKKQSKTEENEEENRPIEPQIAQPVKKKKPVRRRNIVFDQEEISQPT